MTTARRFGLLLGLVLTLAALGGTFAAHRQVASPDVELRAPIREWMLTNFGARDVEEDRTLWLTSLPAKHKFRFTLDGKPYEVWVTDDMTQLRGAVEQVVARHRRRSEPAD
jgi:hypothetical protein